LRLKKWKTSETAPKDGSKFLAIDEIWIVAVVRYLRHRDKFVVAWDHSDFLGMVYWRPMVKLPKRGD
jgi:hypothetical protein